MRLKRVDLPQDVSESVYRRMEAERQARRERAALAPAPPRREKIRADADRQREVILAEAYRDAQRVKGEGDAKAAAIYAEAFNAEPRVLRVLPQPGSLPLELPQPHDVLVLEPNSDFFRYLKEPPASPTGRQVRPWAPRS